MRSKLYCQKYKVDTNETNVDDHLKLDMYGWLVMDSNHDIVIVRYVLMVSDGWNDAYLQIVSS